ncbi:hypothetical protein KY326_01695 [Candidatus Woesearchaeota archaeon]|nr:hypothetical protein [Candidatus Woesearchaeota archaeon]
MSHSQDEEDAEDIDCLRDHCTILLETLNGIHGNFTKAQVIEQIEQIKKRVDYMLADLRGENV